MVRNKHYSHVLIIYTRAVSLDITIAKDRDKVVSIRESEIIGRGPRVLLWVLQKNRSNGIYRLWIWI